MQKNKIELISLLGRMLADIGCWSNCLAAAILVLVLIITAVYMIQS